MKRILLLLILILVMPVHCACAEDTSPRVMAACLFRAGDNDNVDVTREGYASVAYAGYIERGNTAMRLL